MTDDEFNRQILERLNVLIAIELDRDTVNGQKSISNRVERLLAYGLAPKDVAAIINKPMNYVTALTSTKKKRLRKDVATHGRRKKQ